MSLHPPPLKFDQSTRTVLSHTGTSAVLSPQCAVLLDLLLETPNHVVTREAMKQVIWGHNFVSDDSINHLVCRLRKELRQLPQECKFRIVATPKVGYRLQFDAGQSHDLSYWLNRCGAWFSNLN